MYSTAGGKNGTRHHPRSPPQPEDQGGVPPGDKPFKEVVKPIGDARQAWRDLAGKGWVAI